MSWRSGIECRRCNFRTFSSTSFGKRKTRAFNLDTLIICLILSKDSELRVERGKVQCPHFHVELFRKEEDVVLVDLEPINSSIDQAAPALGPRRNTAF